MPDLPYPSYGQALSLSTGDFNLLNCGGFDGREYIKTCMYLDVTQRRWKFHSQLTKHR